MGQVTFQFGDKVVGNHIKVVNKVIEKSQVEVLRLEFEEGEGLVNQEGDVQFETWSEFHAFCELNEECFLVVEVADCDRYEFVDWCNYQVFCEDGRCLDEGVKCKEGWLFTLQCEIDE